VHIPTKQKQRGAPRGKTKPNATKPKKVQKPKVVTNAGPKPSSTTVAKPRYAQHTKSTLNQNQIKSLQSTVKRQALKAKQKAAADASNEKPKAVTEPPSIIDH